MQRLVRLLASDSLWVFLVALFSAGLMGYLMFHDFKANDIPFPSRTEKPLASFAPVAGGQQLRQILISFNNYADGYNGVYVTGKIICRQATATSYSRCIINADYPTHKTVINEDAEKLISILNLATKEDPIKLDGIDCDPNGNCNAYSFRENGTYKSP